MEPSGDEHTTDFLGASAIALPMRSRISTSSTSSTSSNRLDHLIRHSPSYPRSTAVADASQVDWYTNYFDTQVRFSHSTFSLPPDVDTRFKVFFSRFNLRALDLAGQTMHPPGKMARSESVQSNDSDAWRMGKEAAQARREHPNVCRLKPVDPHWHMVTTADESRR